MHTTPTGHRALGDGVGQFFHIHGVVFELREEHCRTLVDTFIFNLFFLFFSFLVPEMYSNLMCATAGGPPLQSFATFLPHGTE